MSKFFRFNEDISELKHADDIKKIRYYLESVGELSCTDSQLCTLWGEFSESWDAGWLITDNNTLEHFAIWLSDYEGDLY